MKTLKRLFKGLLFLFLAIAVLAVSLLAFLQTSPGRLMLAGAINEFGSSPSMAVKVEGIAIGWGLNARVESVGLSDEEGQWLRLSGASLNWRPLALLRGMVDIEAIGVEEIDILRRPATSSAEEASQPSEGGGVPLIPFKVGQLSIQEITLQSPVVGAPLQLTVSGNALAQTDPASIDAALEIRRTDGVEGTLSATARFKPADERLAFSLELKEPRGGLAARLLEIADLPAVDISLSGDGPLDDWQSKLAVSLDGRETVTGTARLSRNETGRALTADLDGDVAALAPPVFDALLLGQTKLLLDAQLSDDFAPLAANFSLKTGTVNLTGQGGRSVENGDLAASADLVISAGGNALIGLELEDRRVTIGETKLHFELSGKQSAANWKATLAADRLGTTEATLGRFDLEASGEAADLDPDALKIPYRLSIAAANVQPAAAEFKSLAGDLGFKSEGVVDGAEKTVMIASATLTHPAADISLSQAELSAEAVSATGSFALPDLARFSRACETAAGGLALR